MANDLDALRARLGLRPQAERRHFVFLDGCGYPFGLTEERDEVTTEREAWVDMYDDDNDEQDARARGVRVVHVDHATYEREFYPRMTQQCPHAEAVSR